MSSPAALWMAHQLCGDRTGAIVELARLGLHQLRDARGAARGNRQHGDGLRGERDRRKVRERVVGQTLVQVLVHHKRRVDGHEQGVAVGRGLGRRLRADDGVGAWPVLDHHRLSPVLAHLLADDARHDVARAAGGKGHDDADGSARKRGGTVLRRCSIRRRERQKGRQQISNRPSHASSRCVLLIVLAILTVARCGGNRLMRRCHSKYDAHGLA